MKLILPVAVLFFLGTTLENCSNEKNQTASKEYKARLEIKGICMNYTLTLIEGEADTALFTPQWTDDHTGKSYKNAFGLANPCTFPKTINAGDEFYFSLDTSKAEDCMVCMAYYPTPPKKLSIKVRTP